jgi:hypothetical protein
MMSGDRELPPQAPDAHVDGAIEGLHAVADHVAAELQQPLARQHAIALATKALREPIRVF